VALVNEKIGGYMIKFNSLDSDYRAMEGLNASFLKEVLRTPAHAKWLKENPKKPTDAMRRGTIYHSAILEPEDYKKRFLQLPDGLAVHTKKGREEAEVYFRSLNLDFPTDEIKKKDDLISWLDSLGLEVVSGEMAADVATMREKVHAHQEINSILFDGHAEVILTAEMMGVSCKGKADWITTDLAILADVKTCQDASQSAFEKTIANYNYDLQAAFYSDLLGVNTGISPRFCFIAVESAAPFETALYWASDDMIQIGRAKYEAAIEQWEKARLSGFYPGYQADGLGEEIDLPAWEKRRCEVEL
jgi:hypothetical protein